MPAGNPEVGEVWTTNAGDREVQGVVANITPDIITLVSLTGNRFRAAPDRILGMWTFSQPVLHSDIECYRPGCTNPGTLIYNERVYTCPTHAPIGTVSRLVTPSRVEPSVPPSAVCSIPCPFCNNPDTVENLQANYNFVSAWQCLRCGEQWVSAFVEGEPLQNDVQLMIDAVSARNVEIESVIVSSQAAHSLTWGTNSESGGPTLIFGYPLRVVDALHRDTGEVFLIHMSRASLARQWTSRGATQEPERPRPVLEAENPVTGQSVFTVNLAVGVEYPNNSAVGGDITLRSGTGALEESGMARVWVQEFDPPTPGTQWVNKGSGSIVTVTKVIPGEGVHYKNEGSSFIMTLDDFLNFHTKRENTIPVAVAVVPIVGEEWENTLNNLVYSVTEVFLDRMVVIVEKLSDSIKTSVKLQEFSSTYWKKVNRRTAYEHLLDDD